MNAMRPIAIQVRPKLMTVTAAGSYALFLPSSERYGPKAWPGQEGRDRVLADDDGEGEERSANRSATRMFGKMTCSRIRIQPAPRLWAASVRLRMSDRLEARVDGAVHVRERQDDVGRDEQDVAAEVRVGQRRGISG